MAQIFLSYANPDRERARAFADELRGRGWTVFWDRTVPPGRVFDEVIAEALQAANCVVVLWSSASVESRWVKEEADDAAQRRILVPVLIDEVKPPLGFRRLQAVRLVGWPGSRDANELDRLVESIREHLVEDASSPRSRVRGRGAGGSPSGSANVESQPQPAPVVAPPDLRGQSKAIAVLVPFVLAGLGVGVWSSQYNSDVGFIAAVPVWILGSLVALWIGSRRG
jgi:hypothetical protein